MSRKVFTAGEVLAAADVNSFLMDQTVMSFAGTAARGSAIGTATEGMITYLEDSDRLDSYNGSAWVPAAGLTFIRSETFSAVSSVSLNNVFSSLYRDYLIVFTGNSSGADDLRYRLRVGGVDATGSNYDSGSLYMTSSAGPLRVFSSGSSFARIGQSQIYRTMCSLLVCDPFITTTTTTNSQITAFGNTSYFDTSWSNHVVSTSYDGITFLLSGGTITGTIKVYGYRS